MEVLKITWFLGIFTLRQNKTKMMSWAHQIMWILQTFIAISCSFFFLPFSCLSPPAAQVDPIRVAISSSLSRLFFPRVIWWGEKKSLFRAWTPPFTYRTDFLPHAVAKMDLKLILVVLPCFALVEGDTGSSHTTHPGFPTAPSLPATAVCRSSTYRWWCWEIADAIFFNAVSQTDEELFGKYVPGCASQRCSKTCWDVGSPALVAGNFSLKNKIM